jgi:serine/threonine protein kinase
MVAWKVAFAALSFTVEAARVNKHAVDLDSKEELFADSEAADELFANLTHQIGFSLGRLDFEHDAALEADAPVRTWPKELDSEYRMERLLACGFHGCAFLAREIKDNDEVVIKVAGGKGEQGAGEVECGRAKYIQYSACGKGEATAKAAQSYLPGCDKYGTLKNGHGYLVLPMAGGTDLNNFKKHIKKNPLSIDDQKSIFAQLVAGVYGMHKAGISHNDMHGKNVVINEDKKIAILDYGLGTAYPCSKNRNQNGYARDGNMFYKYAAMVSDCGKKNQWPGVWIGFVTDNRSYRRKQERCMAVLKEKWGLDKEAEDALMRVWTGNIDRDVDQHFERLFKTRFVQQNLPRSSDRFQLDGTDRCWTWDKAKLKHEMKEAGTVAFTC